MVFKIVPADMEMVSIHCNVKNSMDVYFCTYNVLRDLFNYMSIVKMGSNAMVAANSVVTKDVPEEIVVGGNPAKVTGYFDTVMRKQYEYS